MKTKKNVLVPVLCVLLLLQFGLFSASSWAADAKIYTFLCGYLISNTENFLVNTRVGVQARFPVPFYVIKHGSDWVAFDLGNPELTAKDAAAAIGKDRADRYRPTMKPEDEFQVQIKKLGLTPKDFKAVVLSHSHWDHSGGIDKFQGTGVPIYMQKREMDFLKKIVAEGKSVRSPLEDPKVAEKLNIKQIEGVFDVFGDQSLVAFPMPGHTPGIQVLMVKLGNGGRVLLCSDTLYTLENLDRNILPGVLADPSDILQSFNMMRVLRSLNVAIVPSHDPEYYIGKALAPNPMYE